MSWSLVFSAFNGCIQNKQCISLLNSVYEFNTILPAAQNSVVETFSQRIKWDFLLQHQAGYMTESALSLRLVVRRESGFKQ